MDTVRHALDTLAGVLMASLVPGEGAIDMSTPKLCISVNKTSADHVTERVLEEGRGSFRLPPWCSMVPRQTNCSHDDVIVIVVSNFFQISLTSSPFLYVTMQITLHIPECARTHVRTHAHTNTGTHTCTHANTHKHTQ